MITKVLEKSFTFTSKPIDDSFYCPIRSECCFSVACAPLVKGAHGFIGECRYVDKGAIFWCGKEDDPCLFVIRSGLVAVYNLSEKGEETFYGILSKGQCIGNTDLFIDYEYVHRIRIIENLMERALTDIEVCKFNVDLLKQLLNTNPEYYGVVINAIYNSITSFVQYIEIISTKPIYERIKKILLLCMDLEGGGTEEVTLSLTHEDLAHLVGVDRVTVTRILHELETDGFVKLGNRKMTVTPIRSEKVDSNVRLEKVDEKIQRGFVR